MTSSPSEPHVAGLPALEQRLAYELACLQLPAARWTPAREHEGQPVADVAIIGAGMAGLALAAALVHRGMAVVVYDEAPTGLEGPWATTARMETLRSPKQLAGPALGVPSLTFRAWFEAQFGSAAWEALDKIPRLQWMDYLRWYRRVLALPVHNEHRVTDVWPQGEDGRAEGLVALRIERIEHPGAAFTACARRLVLATGRAGLGGNWVPAWVHGLPRMRWAHSADEFDYARLRGQRVGVVGAGASAMDSAATALDEGAARVHLLVRRHDIPRINKGKGAGSPGFVHGHARLPDEWKWRIRHYIHTQQVPPPRNSTLRVSSHANAFFHLGCAVVGAEERGGALQVRTSAGSVELDFLIFATGFAIDWAQRPMLRHIAPHVRLWRDAYVPEPGQEDEELAASPDLGADFEFQPRAAAGAGAAGGAKAAEGAALAAGASCPGLERIHCFCYPAALSLGVITGDIPAISEGAMQLASGLAGLLYAEDVARHFARMQAFAEPEVFGDEWVASPLPAPLPENRHEC
ncbi:MAG: NAD(P)/FAD-dependent oxidoreductase [Rubrivivax sp.]|nr:NAD(P)/FAD-dependent oxidoreductase [Rubrivivax sp.]